MELGITWPLQRLLRIAVPYGNERENGFCWDAHCITLHGKSSLLLVHCETRYSAVLFDLSPPEWERLDEIVSSEIRSCLFDAGLSKEVCHAYCEQAGSIVKSRTHGRRAVAFLNRAWEDVLAADLLVDPTQRRQPLLNRCVNRKACRCVGRDDIASAQEHLEYYFANRKKGTV